MKRVKKVPNAKNNENGVEDVVITGMQLLMRAEDSHGPTLDFCFLIFSDSYSGACQ